MISPISLEGSVLIEIRTYPSLVHGCLPIVKDNLGKRFIEIRRDNGGEYISLEFKHCFLMSEVIPEITPPH
jgi:hypothetical protein